MYRSIYVPVDNSNYSNQAVEMGILLGRQFESKLTGSHVYAARMHDYRFKQMEFTLPEEYLQENELERQRKIHDSLITMGLKLISDCYLEVMEKKCAEQLLKFEKKMMDGKHHVEILKDIENSDYDLTVLGILGMGKMKDSQIGSVCERVTRHTTKDVWIVKHVPDAKEAPREFILVGVDGSPQSFGALQTAITLAKKFDKKIELISVYDPYLHYQVFNGLVDVLNDKAAKVFRFEEQNQLHEEVIDTGLAQIYQSHLNVAEDIVKRSGLEAKKTLLDGKAFQKILDHTRKNPPWVLVIGRIGVHSDKEDKGLGSNTDNLLRLAPCDILMTTTLHEPELDKKAEESILWTPEAQERMTRVPALVRGIARTGILRLAVEQGHSVITNKVIDEAMDRFMPKNVARQTEELGELLAFKKAREGNVCMCAKCGVSARDPNPVRCAVCGSTEFQKITSDVIDKIVSSEGGAREETSYDGRVLKWTIEARNTLRLIQDGYQRRRCKARIEKGARMRQLNTVTGDFVKEILKDETALPLDQASMDALEAEWQGKEGASALPDLNQQEQSQGLKLIGRDKKGIPLKSVFEWQKDAVERILRVPSGFMRDKVQSRVESLALERRTLMISLDLVEEGVSLGRQMMEEMLTGAAKGQSPYDISKTQDQPLNTAPSLYQNHDAFADERVNNLNEIGILQELNQQRSSKSFN